MDQPLGLGHLSLWRPLFFVLHQTDDTKILEPDAVLTNIELTLSPY